MIDVEQVLGLATIARAFDGTVGQGEEEAAVSAEARHLVVGVSLRPVGDGAIDVELLQVQRRDDEARACRREDEGNLMQVVIQAIAVVLLGGGEQFAVVALQRGKGQRAAVACGTQGDLPAVMNARLPTLGVNGRVVVGIADVRRSPFAAGEVAVAHHGGIGDVFLDVRNGAGETALLVGQEVYAQRLAVVTHYQIEVLIVPAGDTVVKVYASAHERERLGGVGLDDDFVLRRCLGQADADGLGGRVKDEFCRVTHNGIVNQQVDTELSFDTLVVIGACIVADHEASGIETKGGFQDIISHSMGVGIIDENGDYVLSKILEKGKSYPCEYTRPYTTSIDNQTAVDINIYEAGSDAEDIADIESHDLYGSMTLDGIRPAPKGVPSINVTFSYDKNQTLKVTAEDMDTHVRKQILIRENEKVAIKPRQMPVDFMLLLDASSSMRGYPLTEAKKACNALVDDIIDFSMHRLGLVYFHTEANLLLELSQDQQAMRTQIGAICAGGQTNMIAAFDEAAKALQRSTNSKVVIIISDGHPYPASDKQTLNKADELRRQGIRIVAIGVGDGVEYSFLQKLADEGDAYKLNNMNELEDTFRTAIPAIMEKI